MTTTRSRLTRGAVLACAGALAVTLLPAVGAAQAAVPTTPSFTFRSTASGDDVASVADATGASAHALTPAGYQVYSSDISNDGQSWVACMSSGAATVDNYDRTYALVLTHRGSSGTDTRVLSTFCEANPVISADGSTVWWYAGSTVYSYAATYDATTGAITGTPTAVSTGQFVEGTNESALALAVSPGGANASVMFTDGTSTRVRSTAMTTAASKPGYAQVSESTANPAANVFVPKPYSFVYADADTLVYDVVDIKAAAPQAITARTFDTPAGSTGQVAVTPVDVSALAGLYDLRYYASGADSSWYGWKDEFTGTTFVGTDLYRTAFDGSAWTTEGTKVLTRTDGATTYRYMPVASTPPDLQAASNRAVAHSSFTTATASVVYRHRVAYSSFNLYLADPRGAVYTDAAAAEVDKGLLEWSTNGGSSWSRVTTTSGKSVFAVGTRWYNGTSPLLTRNTRLRWTFQGDFFTAAAAPVTRIVRVVPLVTVRKTVRRTATTLYGAVTRKYGTVVLQRKISATRWRTVVTAKMTVKGAYNFGRRVLPHGTYRVVSVADSGWALGLTAGFRV